MLHVETKSIGYCSLKVQTQFSKQPLGGNLYTSVPTHLLHLKFFPSKNMENDLIVGCSEHFAKKRTNGKGFGRPDNFINDIFDPCCSLGGTRAKRRQAFIKEITGFTHETSVLNKTISFTLMTVSSFTFQHNKSHHQKCVRIIISNSDSHTPFWFAFSQCDVGRPRRGRWCWSHPVSPA